MLLLRLVFRWHLPHHLSLCRSSADTLFQLYSHTQTRFQLRGFEIRKGFTMTRTVSHEHTGAGTQTKRHSISRNGATRGGQGRGRTRSTQRRPQTRKCRRTRASAHQLTVVDTETNSNADNNTRSNIDKHQQMQTQTQTNMQTQAQTQTWIRAQASSRPRSGTHAGSERGGRETDITSPKKKGEVERNTTRNRISKQRRLGFLKLRVIIFVQFFSFLFPSTDGRQLYFKRQGI